MESKPANPKWKPPDPITTTGIQLVKIRNWGKSENQANRTVKKPISLKSLTINWIEAKQGYELGDFPIHKHAIEKLRFGFWLRIVWVWENHLAISGAVFFDDPTSFETKSFENLVVIAVLRELIVALSSKARVNLSRDGSSPPLPLLIVLPLLPRRSTSGRRWSSSSCRHWKSLDGSLSLSLKSLSVWRTRERGFS